MLNEISPLQAALIALWALAGAMIVVVLISMAYNSLKGIIKRFCNPSFDGIDEALSANDISFKQASKKLNDYQS